jgi:hypothetical protein
MLKLLSQLFLVVIFKYLPNSNKKKLVLDKIFMLGAGFLGQNSGLMSWQLVRFW